MVAFKTEDGDLISPTWIRDGLDVRDSPDRKGKEGRGTERGPGSY
jgi:hypothetical protein